MHAQQKFTNAANERAREAWSLAKSAWSNSYLNQISLESTIKQRLELIQQQHPKDVENRIVLLETVHLDVQKYFQAKLRLAECMDHLQGTKMRDIILRHTKSEIEAIEKAGQLSNAVSQHTEQFRNIPLAQQHLNLLARDWSAQGSYFWMKQSIDQMLAK